MNELPLDLGPFDAVETFEYPDMSGLTMPPVRDPPGPFVGPRELDGSSGKGDAASRAATVIAA